jgi:hypothetical protein
MEPQTEIMGSVHGDGVVSIQQPFAHFAINTLVQRALDAGISPFDIQIAVQNDSRQSTYAIIHKPVGRSQ